MIFSSWTSFFWHRQAFKSSFTETNTEREKNSEILILNHINWVLTKFLWIFKRTELSGCNE